MKNLTSLLVLACCIACNPTTKQEQSSHTTTTVTAKSSVKGVLSYLGFYRGEIPSATGAGIRTILELKQDSNYKLTMVYLENRDASYTEEGKFTKSDNLITLQSDLSKTPRYFKLHEGQIELLTQEQQSVQGNMGSHYFLLKR